ncbi:hypothetical protein GCM10023205_71140 [Yinghuangia aomiensis]|uniref:Transposase n=1 Tax=Yinghuangia aomiensis TaxID=676205 RepID=A0ABP9I6W5_9ACTN
MADGDNPADMLAEMASESIKDVAQSKNLRKMVRDVTSVGFRSVRALASRVRKNNLAYRVTPRADTSQKIEVQQGYSEIVSERMQPRRSESEYALWD